jgi:glucan phosphoethanolaminetransferase (alkaline phosphatase superfamily)
MTKPLDDLNINLNQNLWGLVVSLGSLGSAEYFKLDTLYWFSFAIAVVMTVSIAITTFAYTKAYWTKKQQG